MKKKRRSRPSRPSKFFTRKIFRSSNCNLDFEWQLCHTMIYFIYIEATPRCYFLKLTKRSIAKVTLTALVLFVEL